MTNELLVEFLYEGASAADLARNVWDRFTTESGKEVRSDFNNGELPSEFSIAVAHEGGTFSGNLRWFDPTDEDRTFAAPSVPCLELSFFIESLRWIDNPSEEVGQILAVIKGVYQATNTRPAYVYGLDPAHVEWIWRGDRDTPIPDTDLNSAPIRDVSWLMLFPPERVETHGKKFLLDAPVWRAEELNDGAVLLVWAANPIDFESFDSLYGYLGITPPD